MPGHTLTILFCNYTGGPTVNLEGQRSAEDDSQSRLRFWLRCRCPYIFAWIALVFTYEGIHDRGFSRGQVFLFFH